MADAQLAGDGPATTEPARAGGRRVAELVAAFIIAPALLDRGGVGRLLLLTLLASPQTLFAFPRTRPVVCDG